MSSFLCPWTKGLFIANIASIVISFPLYSSMPTKIITMITIWILKINKWWITPQSFLFELIKSWTYLIKVFVITRWTTKKNKIGMAKFDTSCLPLSAPLLQPTLHWHSKIKIRMMIYWYMCVILASTV